MADEVTSTGEREKTPEEIERDMLATREALTEKVLALENQVVCTVQNATETINHTVEAVKSFVETAPEAVSDTVKNATSAVSEAVKETFDISGHVQRHPWPAVGISAALGFAVGWFASRPRPLSVSPGYVPPAAGAARGYAAPYATPRYAAEPETAPTEPRTPGFFDQLMGMVGDKAKEVARTAIETVSATVKDTIQTGVPKLVSEATARLTDAADGCATSAYGTRFEDRRGAASS